MSSPNGVPLDEAGIISTSLEAVLYGSSFFMFIVTLWVLLGSRRNHRRINWTMVIVSCLLFALSTAHMVVDIVRIYEGLIKYRNVFPGGPPAFFSDVAQETFVVKNAIYTLQTLVGDGVVIYRCYMVWRSLWVLIVPVLGWCAVAASGVGSVYSVSQATAHSSNIFFENTGRWITAFYASTFSTNIISTGLLAYRIWAINSSVSRSRATTRTLLPVLLIIVDAGFLYFAALLAALICFVRKSNGQYVVLDLISPIISIVFYMIIIRVGIQQSGPLSQKSTVNPTFDASNARSTTSEQYALKPLHIHITQLSETQAEHPTVSTPKQRDEGYSHAV